MNNTIFIIFLNYQTLQRTQRTYITSIFKLIRRQKVLRHAVFSIVNEIYSN